MLGLLSDLLAVACSADVTTGAGKFRADALSVKVPKWPWLKLPAGAGGKGHRYYDWAVIDLAEPRLRSHQLLIRSNRTTGALAYYRCWSPTAVPLATLVRVAGSLGRWVEMAGGGDLPVRKEPGRTRRAPGPTVPPRGLAGHPGHARPRLSRVRAKAGIRTREPRGRNLRPFSQAASAAGFPCRSSLKASRNSVI